MPPRLPSVLIACALLGACGKTVTAEGDGGLDGGVTFDDAFVREDGAIPPVDVPNAVDLETTAGAEVRAGDVIMLDCVILDEAGEVFSSAGRTPSYRVVPEDAAVFEDGQLIARRAGTVQVSCSIASLMLTDETPAEVTILPGAPAELLTSLDRRSIVAGESVSARCDAIDAFGNATVAEGATLALEPSGEGVSLEGLSATLTRAGLYDARCSLSGATSDAVRLEVLPGLPADLRLARVPEQPVYGLGQVIGLSALVVDAFGNRVRGAPLSFEAPVEAGGVGTGRYRFGVEGTFELAVAVDGPTEGDAPLRATATVTINGAGPAIRCDAPLDGAFVDATPGTEIVVSGTVADAAGVASVSVGGEPVPLLPEGRFEAPHTVAYGINFVDVVSVDGLGVESSETCSFLATDRWEPEDAILDDTLSLALRQDAIDDFDRSGPVDSLGDLLALLLNGSELAASLDGALTAANPLKPRSCDASVFGICVFRSRIDYRPGTARLAGPNTTELRLVPGGLQASVDLRNLSLGLATSGTISSNGTIGFSRARASVTFDVSVEAGSPSVRVRSVDSVDVSGLSTSFSGVGGFLIDLIVGIARGAIEGLVEDLLRGFVGDTFNGVLDGLLSGLDLSDLTSFALPRLDGSGTIDAGLGIRFTSADTTTERLLLGIGTRVSATPVVARPALGVPLPPPPGASLLLDPTGTSPTAAAIHVGFLTQLLFSLWRGGLLDATLGAEALGGGAAGDLEADIDGALPLVAEARDDGSLRVHVGALRVGLALPGLFDEPIELSVGAKLGTSLAVVDGDLEFGDIGIEELAFTAEGVSLDARSRELVESLLADLLEALVGTALNDALPSVPVPTVTLPPTLAGLGLPAGIELGLVDPSLTTEAPHLVLRGGFGAL
ncbi:MAG: hypothetical protein AAGH15_16475 [Myxococcota bacterium]